MVRIIGLIGEAAKIIGTIGIIRTIGMIGME